MMSFYLASGSMPGLFEWCIFGGLVYWLFNERVTRRDQTEVFWEVQLDRTCILPTCTGGRLPANSSEAVCQYPLSQCCVLCNSPGNERVWHTRR
ncbi:hypothetical protein J6590_075501 [Homalodisca vitripennis]|nr:hypothetical protein J6590_075501 [Homalodisca vitripennis]